MTSPLGISPEMQEAVADRFGSDMLTYAEDSVRDDHQVAQHLEMRLDSFESAGEALPLRRVTDAPFLDLASPNPSATSLVSFLPAAQNSALLQRAAWATGKRLTAENTAAAFVTKRFVAPPPPESGLDAQLGYADAALLVHTTPGGRRATFIRISRSGIRSQSVDIPQVERATPPWVSRVDASLPPRNSRPFASPRDLVGRAPSGTYSATAVRTIGEPQVNLDQSYEGIGGVVFQGAELVDEGKKLLFRPPSAASTESRAELSTTRQALASGPPDIEIDDRWVPSPTTPAPPGLTYGDVQFGCGGRSTPETCFQCCDGKEGTLVGFAVGLGTAAGTAGVLIGVEAGALAGIWAGPAGVVIGGLIGGAIGCAIALLASSNCYDGCTRLYAVPDMADRRLRLTAVAKRSGQTMGYVGVDDQGYEWALTTAQAVAAIRGGVEIFVADRYGETPTVAGGRGTLRTPSDARRTNNIGSLPVIRGLPNATGIGLG